MPLKYVTICKEKLCLCSAGMGTTKCTRCTRCREYQDPIGCILYLQRSKHPTQKCLPSMLGKQRIQRSKQLLFGLVLWRVYTKQKMKEQKKTYMSWRTTCISSPNKKSVSMLAYIATAGVTFLNWKNKPRLFLAPLYYVSA